MEDGTGADEKDGEEEKEEKYSRLRSQDQDLRQKTQVPTVMINKRKSPHASYPS